MQAKEVREKKTEELQGKLNEMREELFKLRFNLYSGQLKDSSRLKAMRRDIARVETILRERDIALGLADELAVKKEN